MRHPTLITALVSVSLLSSCKQAEQTPVPENVAAGETSVAKEEANTTDVAPHRFGSWAGKWTGVEGMYLTVTPIEPGKYSLEMQSDLDTKGEYEGSDSERGIQFVRAGEKLSLTRASGDETGLKYLAGKKDCLMVKSGEGYCRD